MSLEVIETEYALFEPQKEVSTLQDVARYTLAVIDNFDSVSHNIGREIKVNKAKLKFEEAVSIIRGVDSSLLDEVRDSLSMLRGEISTINYYLNSIMSTYNVANEANCKEAYKMICFTAKRYVEKGKDEMDDFSSFVLQENTRINRIKPVEKTKGNK